MDISDFCRKFSARYTAENRPHSAEGQEGGERNMPHCHEEKENGAHQGPTHLHNPLSSTCPTKGYAGYRLISKGALVKAEEDTVEKPLILQKKAISSLQQVRKVPGRVLSRPPHVIPSTSEPLKWPLCTVLPPNLHSHKSDRSVGLYLRSFSWPRLSPQTTRVSWASLVHWAASQSANSSDAWN